MDKCFQIGDFCFRLICEEGVNPPDNFMLFERESVEPVYTYEMIRAGEIPQPRGTLLVQRKDMLVFGADGLEMRYIGYPGMQGFFACYEEISAEAARVHLSPAVLGELWIDPLFTGLLALERRMVPRGGLILHCAYMRYREEAILFSAPSETGKTTQATLWEKYRGSRVINGDRSLLQCVDGRWTAQGWPVCGSSEVCHDEATPIRAIVMLSQGKTDTVQRLSPYQAFSQIYSQITINRWNGEAHRQAMDGIERLVTQTPVFHLSCTISEEAVRCLERAVYAEA